MVVTELGGNTQLEIEHDQLLAVARLMKSATGINFHEGKQELLKARLGKRLTQLNIRTFKEYINYLQSSAGSDEYIIMINLLSTNVTEFYREPLHFDYMKEHIISPKKSVNTRPARKLRIWSAGCSTGEEPYSIVLTIVRNIENTGAWDIKVLATDISERVLSCARKATYHERQLKNIPNDLRKIYFDKLKKDDERLWQVKEYLSRYIDFGRLNLMAGWPMSGPFDVIFCRNVMIYFDRETQHKLVNRFWEILRPGGILFIGHAESLINFQDKFDYIKPTIYSKRVAK